MKVFSPSQAATFLQAASQDRWAALWQLLLTTGMRPGEALALRWTDIEGSKIRIQRNLVRTPDGRWELKEPKTARGRRTVTMPEMTQTLLRQERRNQVEARLKAGSAYADLGFVFAVGNGSPLDWRVVVQRHFHPILKRAGLPRIRPYDLRHTSATLLLGDGVNVKVVAERLGHASAALTLDVYAHVTPDMQAEAAGGMQQVLNGYVPIRLVGLSAKKVLGSGLQVAFSISSTEVATTYRAGVSRTAIALKCALPQLIFALSLSRRSSVKRLLFVSTTK